MKAFAKISASLVAGALLALPALAQYNGFKASITKQASPLNLGENAIVELNTYIPMPYQLQFQALATPQGAVLKDAKTSTSCPDARDARMCRQYFSFAIDAHSSGKCNLNGDYLAKFHVSCQPGDSNCRPGQHEVAFSLKSENFCSEKVATTAANAYVWTHLNGLKATDVGAGADKFFLTWFLDPRKTGDGGLDVVSLGYDKTSAMRRGGKALSIDVDAQGAAFVANDKGEMYRYVNNAWQKLPGLAKDVGVGANGTAWCIGANQVPGGFGIYRWNSARNDWDGMPGGAVRIDVDPQGNAWVVNAAGQIFRWTGSSWSNVPGLARDVGIGSTGAVFVAGADGIVYKWNPQTNGWESRGNAKVTNITVNSAGAPVVTTADNEIYVGQP